MYVCGGNGDYSVSVRALVFGTQISRRVENRMEKNGHLLYLVNAIVTISQCAPPMVPIVNNTSGYWRIPASLVLCGVGFLKSGAHKFVVGSSLPKVLHPKINLGPRVFGFLQDERCHPVVLQGSGTRV